jgi:isopentenyl phosphate kinase
MVRKLNPIIIKLGGSVITEKDKLFKPSTTIIERLAREIAKANVEPIVIIHGGGSFGHPVAHKYDLVKGYKYSDQLIGFAKTRQAMVELNKLIIDALINNNLSAVSVQPSSCIITQNGRIDTFNIEAVKKLLDLNLIPVLYGDAVLDYDLGFTILSGDQLVAYLAVKLISKKIIIGVDVDGLYTKDPKKDSKANLIKHITIKKLKEILEAIDVTTNTDVTGGMKGKLIELIPALRKGTIIKIINAKIPNRLIKALKDEEVKGTTLSPR